MTRKVVLSIKRLWHFCKYLLNVLRLGPLKTKMKLIGVSGTDGKTTTSNFIYSILKRDGKKVGMICTIGVFFGDTKLDSGSHTTTPTYAQMKTYLTSMEERGVEYVIVEATSHGLFQYRLQGLRFVGSVLTNITREHLDYFVDFKSYASAKQLLFGRSEFAVVNVDDVQSGLIQHKKLIKYGVVRPSDFKASNIAPADEGTKFEIEAYGEVKTANINFPGVYNVYNALAASALCRELGISWDSILGGLQDLKSVLGRLDEVELLGCPFKVIVDFAHTPNALKELLTAYRERLESGKIILVFGSAGLRDATKRPLMGSVAVSLCDKVIVTAEDPRTENVKAITNQILKGLSSSDLAKCEKIPDRFLAIKKALEFAKPGDVVLVTGKGHEDTMNLGQGEVPWSDFDAIRKAWLEISGKL